nr:hypothetical protein CFP56_02021 [Quercus suber]
MLFRKFPKTVDTFDNTENPKDVSDIPLNKENRKQSDAHENPNPNPKPQYSRRVFQSYRSSNLASETWVWLLITFLGI